MKKMCKSGWNWKKLLWENLETLDRYENKEYSVRGPEKIYLVSINVQIYITTYKDIFTGNHDLLTETQ